MQLLRDCLGGPQVLSGDGRLLTWDHRINKDVAEDFLAAFDWCRDHGWTPLQDHEGLRATMAEWKKWGAGDGH